MDVRDEDRLQDERALRALMALNPFKAVDRASEAFIASQSPDYDEVGHRLREYAASYGWPAVFRVMATAIEEYQERVGAQHGED